MADDDSPVDALVEDHQAVLQHLIETQELSFAATLETTVPKVFLLASASWLETRVQKILLDFFAEAAGDLQHVTEFIRINALERKYHTLFDWEKRKPSKFFSLFGRDMKAHGAAVVRDDPEFAAQFYAFMELGDLRNQVAHKNYAAFVLEKTADEVYGLYLEASKFVDRLADFLRSWPPVEDEPAEPSTEDEPAEPSTEDEP